MSDLTSVIELVFRGIDQASNVAEAAADNIAESFADLDGRVQSIAGPFANLADKLLAAEVAALSMGAALVAVAVNAADAFDEGFNEIATLIDEPKDALGEFRQEILAYAATSTASLAEVNGAFYNAISLGVAYTDSLAAVTAAEKLAVAGKADLNITLQALIGTMNAYGVGITDANKYSDIFFNTVKAGKTTIPELAASISGVTGTAALAKVSFEEIAAAIATLTASGAPTSAAVTQINAVLSAIIKPTKEAADLAADLGIKFDATALASGGLSGVLAEVASKTQGSATQMAVLFSSTEALKGAVGLAVTNNEKFTATLELMKTGTGATEAAFNKMKDSTVTLGNALTAALVAFGDPLLDSFDGLQEALGKLALAFIQLANSGGLTPLQELINANFTEITATIEKIAENLPAAFANLDWSELINSLEGLKSKVGELFKAFFGDIDLTTVEGLTSALQTLMNAFSALTTVVTGILDALKPLAAALGGAAQEFTALDQASALDFGKFLGSMKLLVDAGTGLGAVLIAIGESGVTMSEVLDGVFGGLRVILNGLQVGFDALALGLVAVWQTALEGALALYELNPFADDSQIAQAKEKIKEVELLGESIAQNLTRNAGELKEGWNQATGETAEKAQAMREKLAAARDALDAAGNAAKTAGNDVKELGQRVPVAEFDGAIGALRRFEDAAGSIKLGESLVKEMDEAKEKAKQFEKDLQEAITGGNEGGYTVTFNAEGLPEITANAKTLKEAFKEVDGTVKTTADGFKYIQDATGPASTGMVLLADGTIKAGEAVDKAGASFSQLGPSLFKSEDAAKKLAAGMDANTTALAKTFDELFKTQVELNNFTVKMEEIASNERIKKMEFIIDLKVAQVQAQTQQIQAAFASLDGTIKSTGDVISSIFGAIGDIGGFYALEKLEIIRDQLEIENKLRTEAAEQQKKLVEQQIKSLELRNEQMARGDALIKITADGLKPHLEAIMWEILEAVQIRATAEGEQFLLGMA